MPVLQPGQLGDLADRARGEVALGRDHAAQHDEPALEAEDALELLVGRLEHDRVLELVDCVVDLLQHGEEAVGERVADAVDDELLVAARVRGDAAVQLVELGAAPAPHGHDPAAADHEVDLDELRLVVARVLGLRLPHAVEDDQHLVAVAVELRPLSEVLHVLERERVPAEALAERGELRVGGSTRSSQKNSSRAVSASIVGSSTESRTCIARKLVD